MPPFPVNDSLQSSQHETILPSNQNLSSSPLPLPGITFSKSLHHSSSCPQLLYFLFLSKLSSGKDLTNSITLELYAILSIVSILQGDKVLAKEWICNSGIVGMSWMRFLWVWQGCTPESYYRGNQVLCLFIRRILGVAFKVTAPL